MKFLPLIWAGLWRKPTRTVFTFLSIVLAFVLFGLLTGLDRGFALMRETARLDRLVSDPRFGAPFPLSYRDQIERIPGVVAVSAYNTFFGFPQDPKNGLAVIAIDNRYFQLRSEFTATKDQIDALARTRTGAITMRFMANKFGWKVGDKISLTSTTAQQNGSKVWTFDLLAIVDDTYHPGLGSYMFVNYDYFDEARIANKGTVTRFMTRIDDLSRAAEISGAIDALSANSAAPSRTTSERANIEASLQQLGDINFLVDSVGGAVLFMLLFITGNSMTQSVRERIPEFGVMKTLGFPDRGVLLMMLTESALKFVPAAVIGLLIAKKLIELSRKMNVPQMYLTWTALLLGIAMSLIAAAASAFLPALRAQRVSIVDALAGR